MKYPCLLVTLTAMALLTVANSASAATPIPLPNKTVFPATNLWNKDISKSPVDPYSDNFISYIGKDKPLHPDFGTIYGIPYNVVDGTTIPKVPVTFQYASESDKGPYPIPTNPLIEGGSDRHILIIDANKWILYELYAAQLISGKWKAGSGAIWNLNTNAKRPAGWTSADAAGLPIFPGLVRFDEVRVKKVIDHAIRFTVPTTRKAYVAPASHWASNAQYPYLMPMGTRLRLKASFDISKYPADDRVILTALKKYGMILADNGSAWYITGAPDKRWNDDILHRLTAVTGKDFEVVKLGTVVHP